MILKKQVYQPDKRVNPFVGILLFIISIVLLVVTGPFGFVYGVFLTLFTKGLSGLADYLLKIAISIDQLGNVLMQHLLNALWTKKGGYKFGNRDETISSALGRNKKLERLTGFGKLIDKILDLIDPNHSLNSIDYYIEPTEQIIDTLAWIHIIDGKILSTRTKAGTKYYIPGGKRQPGETDTQVLVRKIKEELAVDLELPTLNFVGIFEAQADGQKPGVLVRKTCYTAHYRGKLLPGAEIEEIAWLNYSDIDKVAEDDVLIFDHLYKSSLLY